MEAGENFIISQALFLSLSLSDTAALKVGQP